MYIKRVRKSNRNSKKCYEYLHLVENVRTENGPRQRLIMNLGNISVSPEQYKELANCDEDGFSKYSRLYPGNHAERRTLAQIIESLVALRPSAMSCQPTSG